jgi:DNA-binding NarL/FixJ family response regulator
MSMVRILIADDHLVYREGMRALLAPDGAIEIVGEVGSGDEVVTEALRLAPDVVLMDLKMPGLNGIEATRRIHEQHPQIKVLVVTMFDDDDSVFAAMRAGAHGYLLKDADQEEIVRAIRAVQRGEAIFGPAVAARMIDYFSGFANRTRARPGADDDLGDLTERERQILTLIAQGLSNAAIAARLSLSIKTVQNYVSNIFAKLQVEDRAQAMLRARDAGLGGRSM